MSGSVNKSIIVGRLGQDPEVKYTKEGKAVAKFSVATDEQWKDSSGEKQQRTEWLNIVAFDKLAEIAGKYLAKGSQVFIEGKIQTRSWEKDGVKRYTTEIRASQIVMLGSKPESDRSESQSTDDSDLPF